MLNKPQNDTTIEQDYIDTYKQKVLTHRFKNETKTSRNRHPYIPAMMNPNAEENYADLLAKVPWAKRVHGIKGSAMVHPEIYDEPNAEVLNFLKQIDLSSRWR